MCRYANERVLDCWRECRAGGNIDPETREDTAAWACVCVWGTKISLESNIARTHFPSEDNGQWSFWRHRRMYACMWQSSRAYLQVCWGVHKSSQHRRYGWLPSVLTVLDTNPHSRRKCWLSNRPSQSPCDSLRAFTLLAYDLYLCYSYIKWDVSCEKITSYLHENPVKRRW